MDCYNVKIGIVTQFNFETSEYEKYIQLPWLDYKMKTDYRTDSRN